MKRAVVLAVIVGVAAMAIGLAAQQAAPQTGREGGQGRGGGRGQDNEIESAPPGELQHTADLEVFVADGMHSEGGVCHRRPQCGQKYDQDRRQVSILHPHSWECSYGTHTTV